MHLNSFEKKFARTIYDLNIQFSAFYHFVSSLKYIEREKYLVVRSATDKHTVIVQVILTKSWRRTRRMCTRKRSIRVTTVIISPAGRTTLKRTAQPCMKENGYIYTAQYTCTALNVYWLIRNMDIYINCSVHLIEDFNLTEHRIYHIANIVHLYCLESLLVNTENGYVYKLLSTLDRRF